MKIGIIGAGALGSVWGGLLLEAGLDVVFVERDESEVNTVTEHGLWLEGVSGDRLLRPRIVAASRAKESVDLALVTVKSYDTASAVGSIEKIISDDSAVLTLQNGIGNYETLDAAFPGRVLLGTTTVGAMTVGPGRFRHTGFGQTHLGEADGRVRERTRLTSEALTSAKAGPVHVVENAVGCVWSKLVINAAINAAATLLRVRNGGLPASEAGRRLIHDVVTECLTIAEAAGIELIFDDPEAKVIEVCEGTAGNLNSMFQDILAARRTEIDFINGALVREAESRGLAAPVNRTLASLIQALEATRESRV